MDNNETSGSAMQRPSIQAATTAPGDEVPAGTPGSSENTCPDCQGSGRTASGPCPTCLGTGTINVNVGDA